MAQTAPTPVDALPTAPSTSSPSIFAAVADAFVAALATFRTQINNIATNVYNNAVDAYTNALASAASASTSSTGSASALAAANFKGTYASRTGAAVVPYSVSHLGHFWMLLSNLADVTAKVPGTDVEWQVIGAAPWIRKTGTYTAISGDRIKASTTGGAWSLTFPVSPADGDEIEVQDVNGTFHTANLTLLANGKKIMGFTTSWVLDTRYAHLVFVYDSTLGDWRI